MICDNIVATDDVRKTIGRTGHFGRFNLPRLGIGVAKRTSQRQLTTVHTTIKPTISLQISNGKTCDIRNTVTAYRTLLRFRVSDTRRVVPHNSPRTLTVIRTTAIVPRVTSRSLVALISTRTLVTTGTYQKFGLQLSGYKKLKQSLTVTRLTRSTNVTIRINYRINRATVLSTTKQRLTTCLPRVDFYRNSCNDLLLHRSLDHHPVRFNRRKLTGPLGKPKLKIRVRSSLLRGCTRRVVGLPPRTI